MNLLDLTTRHKELEARLHTAFDALKKGGGINPMSLMKVLGGGFDLSALGLPSDLFEVLAEYQQVSAQLRNVVEKVAEKMEAQHA
ncbi:hypothetical protein [Vibrio taketomensis]|uniref:hypothetical protein n=1 Tax=Vibrio taketomensis TaxID=2572923 RepID=UPI00138991DC|nr:hypothetical protein [Vibrio taketomensis]